MNFYLCRTPVLLLLSPFTLRLSPFTVNLPLPRQGIGKRDALSYIFFKYARLCGTWSIEREDSSSIK